MRLAVNIVRGLIALVIIVVTEPLLAAMRADRRERNARDVGRSYPYDDNDPGTDVDA